MGDPAGASRHVLSTLAPGGSWMIVEPYAGDRVEENLNPVGRAYYAASTLICTPCSLAQEVGLALGAQAGEGRLRDVVQGAGFTTFRRAVQSPFNLVFEAKRLIARRRSSLAASALPAASQNAVDSTLASAGHDVRRRDVVDGRPGEEDRGLHVDRRLVRRRDSADDPPR